MWYPVVFRLNNISVIVYSKVCEASESYCIGTLDIILSRLFIKHFIEYKDSVYRNFIAAEVNANKKKLVSYRMISTVFIERLLKKCRIQSLQ